MVLVLVGCGCRVRRTFPYCTSCKVLSPGSGLTQKHHLSVLRGHSASVGVADTGDRPFRGLGLVITCVCLTCHVTWLRFWFQVRFSPVVHVHVVRSWLFARRASRRGNWEEMARDRERFQRRVKEVEACVGPCLSPAHRIKMRAYLDGALTL